MSVVSVHVESVDESSFGAFLFAVLTCMRNCTSCELELRLELLLFDSDFGINFVSEVLVDGTDVVGSFRIIFFFTVGGGISSLI